MSAEAVRIAGDDLVRGVSRRDLPPGVESVLAAGWSVVDDAVVLTDFYESYYGRRDLFNELVDYEAAVNGRGIPDEDISERNASSIPLLLRRGVAFAWAALFEQRTKLPGIQVAAYISVSPILLEPDLFTGNVTFCSIGPGRPLYIDPRNLVQHEIVVEMQTEDCHRPL
ncbi:hypothetical protein [Micromonospora sp. NPDC049102]|uniref:hypothetical protein n=1 Tax=Micromonospora sp. NPDC049102 TaxID=3364265 RepID=UPI003718C1BD